MLAAVWIGMRWGRKNEAAKKLQLLVVPADRVQSERRLPSRCSVESAAVLSCVQLVSQLLGWVAAANPRTATNQHGCGGCGGRADDDANNDWI